MTLQNGSLKINEWCSLLTLPSLGWWWLFILSGLTTEFPSDSCLIFIPWFGIQRKKWETAHGDGYHSLMMLGMICSWDHGLPPVFLYSAAARCGWSQEPLPRKKGAGGAGGAGATPSNQKVPLPAGLLLPGEVPQLQGWHFCDIFWDPFFSETNCLGKQLEWIMMVVQYMIIWHDKDLWAGP